MVWCVRQKLTLELIYPLSFVVRRESPDCRLFGTASIWSGGEAGGSDPRY